MQVRMTEREMTRLMLSVSVLQLLQATLSPITTSRGETCATKTELNTKELSSDTSLGCHQVRHTSC